MIFIYKIIQSLKERKKTQVKTDITRQEIKHAMKYLKTGSSKPAQSLSDTQTTSNNRDKQENHEFQVLVALTHKGDHGESWHTLK